jgi:hypothetical protein
MVADRELKPCTERSFLVHVTDHANYHLSRCDVMMSATNLYPFRRSINKFILYQKALSPHNFILFQVSTMWKSDLLLHRSQNKAVSIRMFITFSKIPSIFSHPLRIAELFLFATLNIMECLELSFVYTAVPAYVFTSLIVCATSLESPSKTQEITRQTFSYKFY